MIGKVKIITVPAPPQKPHPWNYRDAKYCIHCGEPFKRKDSVYTDVTVTLHAGCLPDYGKEHPVFLSSVS